MAGAHGRVELRAYLTHMFIVLATVALYRTAFGETNKWTFTVYVPALLASYALALAAVERYISHPGNGVIFSGSQPPRPPHSSCHERFFP